MLRTKKNHQKFFQPKNILGKNYFSTKKMLDQNNLFRPKKKFAKKCLTKKYFDLKMFPPKSFRPKDQKNAKKFPTSNNSTKKYSAII